MKKFYSFWAMLLIWSVSFAQSHGQAGHDHRNCGTMQALEAQLDKDPTLRQRMENIEEQTRSFLSKGKSVQTREVITIPVVFHIVWRTSFPAENISDAQVQSQLDVLNADFRKLNADVSQVPAPFQALAADYEIQFCLAKRTPQGQASTGIERYQSTRTTTFGTNDAVKDPAQGGAAAWDASGYMNFWVCAIGGGILGYAQFPGGPAETDGIVCDYRYTGSNGTATAPFNLGRTATHEVGHYLNLRHIWGDANCGNDFVNDTPTQQRSNGGCPTFPLVTCGNGPDGDMFMNYMDYTDDRCMFMFTSGQKARSLALFAPGGFRASLKNSTACQPPLIACNPPASVTVSNITQTSATINWATATNAIGYTVDVKPTSSTIWSSTPANGTSAAIISLTPNTQYQYRVRTNCLTGNSAFSAIGTFTTLSDGGGGGGGGGGNECVDNFEPNNSRTAAKQFPLGTTIKGIIPTSTDNDYFFFNNSSSQRNIRISLEDLPADYDLRLYSSSGANVRSSTNTGLTSEGIIYNNAPVGRYSVRVQPFVNQSSPDCYSLTVQIGSSRFRTTVGGDDDGQLLEALKVTPNPANDVLTIQYVSEGDEAATVRMLDLTGREVIRLNNALSYKQSSLNINVQQLVGGMYFVVVQQGESIQTKKVVIKH